jgi:hypothetical protein
MVRTPFRFGLGADGDVHVPDDLTFRRAAIMSEGTRINAEVLAPKAAAGRKLPTIIMAHG